jgi:hypothetical protein
MIQHPKPLSLMLCDQVIFELGTQKPSLIGVFNGLGCSQFPSTPRPIDVFAALTDGQGQGDFSLTVTHLETEYEIARQEMTMMFPDPLRVVNFRFRFQNLSFPKPGVYVFELFAEEEALCHRRILAFLKEE